MGLAASQVRLLTLTADKLSMEHQIMLNTNRKMALTAEMSRLAFEKNSRLNSYQYQVSTLDNGLQEISYKYLMGKSGGVQDISTKSEDHMMLFESNTGRVVLSSDMANKIGDWQKLRSNQYEKYAAIARLCGDTNLTVPEDLPSNIDLAFCPGPELVKAICDGKYNSYSLNDLTTAINKYQLYAMPVNSDGEIGNLLPAFQDYMKLDETNPNNSDVYGYLNTVENIYGDPTLLGAKYISFAAGGSNATACEFSWAHAYQASGDTGIHHWENSADSDDYSIKNKVINFGTLKDETEQSKRSLLTNVVRSLARAYSKVSKISVDDMSSAINQTVNEFLSNQTGYSALSTTDSINTIRATYFKENNDNTLERDFFDSTIRYRTLAGSTLDSNRLTIYTASNGNGGKDMYIDASALVSYFHGALLGEGIGYTSDIGPDTLLYGSAVSGSSSTASNTPVLNHDKYENGSKWKEYGIQKFVPAGQNTTQWMDSFNKLISDVKFYYPIVEACIKFGYTTGYDELMEKDPSYVDEALQNGTFQIMDFDATKCELDGSHNTKYYLMFSEIFKSDNESQKLEVQAWYQKEKSSIKHKEDVLDTMIEQMNTELNSINTEIESIKSFIDDSKNHFEWGKG